MVFLKLLTPLGWDFRVYFESAWMILRGINPYAGILSSDFPYNYPPISLIFLWPLGLLPLELASVIWNLLSVTALFASLGLTISMYWKPISVKKVLLTCVLFTLPYFPEKFNLGMGQINNFILLFSVLAFYFYQRKKLNLSAMFLALGIGTKLAPAIFIIYFLVKRDFRQVIRIFLWLGVLWVITLLLVPVSWQADYLFKVFPLSFGIGAKDWYYNQSLFGFLARLFTNKALVAPIFYTISGFLVLSAIIRAKKIGDGLSIGSLFCLYLIVHPIAHQHYFMFAAVPLIILAGSLGQVSSQHKLFLAVAYMLLAANIANPVVFTGALTPFLSHQFFGVLGLYLMTLWKNNYDKIISWLWVLLVAYLYVSHLMCRGGICF